MSDAIRGPLEMPTEMAVRSRSGAIQTINALKAEINRLQKKLDYQDMDGGCLEAENARLREAAKEYMSVVEHAMEFYPFKVDGNQLREALGAGDE